MLASGTRRVFSGIQPTGGVPHLGNYLGAIRNWVKLSVEDSRDAAPHRSLFCIVDLHALTTQPDPRALRQNVRDMATCLLACGLDASKCTLFVQSHVPFTLLFGDVRFRNMRSWGGSCRA
jgi:tryptophanyl-tRNA synthetase